MSNTTTIQCARHSLRGFLAVTEDISFSKREAAKVRARFRLEILSSVLSDEEKEWMVRNTSDETQSEDMWKG